MFLKIICQIWEFLVNHQMMLVDIFVGNNTNYFALLKYMKHMYKCLSATHCQYVQLLLNTILKRKTINKRLCDNVFEPFFCKATISTLALALTGLRQFSSHICNTLYSFFPYSLCFLHAVYQW